MGNVDIQKLEKRSSDLRKLIDSYNRQYAELENEFNKDNNPEGNEYMKYEVLHKKDVDMMEFMED